ncbi:hypothetical protein [uncultured Tenacibaculum sp.]|uniref:hypothetical protein n=1 Tax=uncultured Tenacibaculum sp. TaxID=174713 RepID=UPI00260F4D8D|nr:hypothetical protein [uncultured Tenacibaculum sp.]
MKTSIDILKSWFQTGDKPTENQFENLIDSFHHKDDGNIISNYEVLQNGDVSFTFSDGNTTKIEKFVLPNTMPQNFIEGLVETLNSKINKTTGKQLSDENFSLELKQKLEGLQNYIHPEFHQITEIEGLQEIIEAKVDNIAGKQLSDENFSSEEKEKLAGLENYVAPDSKPISYIEELEDSLAKINQDLENKVEIIEGKQLSDENFTSEEKEKLSSFNINTFSTISDGENIISANGQADQLVFEGATIDVDRNIITIDKPETSTTPLSINDVENLQDELDSLNTDVSEKISSEDLQIELEPIKNDLDNKIDEDGLEPYIENLENQISNRVTGEELHSELDQVKLEIDDKINESQVDEKLTEVKSEIDNKVDKVPGKQLSTNDFTTEEKQKLAGLNNSTNRDVQIYLATIRQTGTDVPVLEPIINDGGFEFTIRRSNVGWYLMQITPETTPKYRYVDIVFVQDKNYGPLVEAISDELRFEASGGGSYAIYSLRNRERSDDVLRHKIAIHFYKR